MPFRVDALPSAPVMPNASAHLGSPRYFVLLPAADSSKLSQSYAVFSTIHLRPLEMPVKYIAVKFLC